MNIKYIKASVIVMTVILVLGIPILIIGFIQKSKHPDLIPLLGSQRTNYTQSPHLNAEENSTPPQHIFEQNNPVAQVVVSSSLKPYEDLNLTIPKGYSCTEPHFGEGGMTFIHCSDKKTNKHRIITVNLYEGKVLGQMDY